MSNFPGKIVGALTELGGAQIGVLVGSLLIMGVGVWRLASRPQPFRTTDLLLCGAWMLAGFVVALTLFYVHQHARPSFYLLSVALIGFAMLYPHFAIGTGVAILIMVIADALT